ncbi:hypothetical protein THAOC_09360, partial [Thalassiosira oceanica]
VQSTLMLAGQDPLGVPRQAGPEYRSSSSSPGRDALFCRGFGAITRGGLGPRRLGLFVAEEVPAPRDEPEAGGDID